MNATLGPINRALTRRGFKGVVFDVDGVLTDTARIHFRAWRSLFDEILSGRDVRAFGQADYEQLVDGRTRLDGLKAVLTDRGILPQSRSPDAAPVADRTITEWAERKQELYLKLVKDEGVQRFPDVMPCLELLRVARLKPVAASASRNAKAVLSAAGLHTSFEALVDGNEAARLGLEGKPAPDLFLEAACRIGLAPWECVLIEDALAGLQAGVRGGFGLVVAVDRSGSDRLDQHLLAVADVVVRSLTELPWAELSRPH